jgi:hypothetical protein
MNLTTLIQWVLMGIIGGIIVFNADLVAGLIKTVSRKVSGK